MGISAIGKGTLLVENSTIQGRSFIKLRPDFGSTWQGKIIIRNCIFVPLGIKSNNVGLINGYYSGKHNFGYTCYMPEHINIENLQIKDADYSSGYKGPVIFTNFNPDMTDDSYYEKFPYIRTREVTLRNVTTASGKSIRLSNNPIMFKCVTIDKN